VIDNNSNCSKTLDFLTNEKNAKRIKLIEYNKTFNYSEMNNFAVNFSRGEILLFLNNDTKVITKNWLTEIISHAIRKDIGCVGVKLLYADKKIQHAGVVMGIDGLAGHSFKYQKDEENGYFGRLKIINNVSAVTGAALAVKKDTFEKVGGFDSKNLKIAFNDIDLCLKISSLGFRNIYTPFAKLYHLESQTRSKINSRNEVSYMQRKWASVIDLDPLFNPNLSLSSESYKLNMDTPHPKLRIA
jgi:GT2 family glycosyltransferase